MSTQYRIYTENDVDKLVEFWNQNSGWDVIDRKEWERRFYHTPLGPTNIVLAEDELNSELIGQFIFFPSLITVKGQQLNAARPFAPVVRKQSRSLLSVLAPLEIIYKMYVFGTKYLASQGITLIHMLPDPRWQRGFQLIGGTQTSSFPLWSLPFPFEMNFELPAGYEIETISPADLRIDELWNRTINLYECSIVRNTSLLPWKLSHGNYQLTALLHDGNLVALSASIYKQKDKQWLICDVLAQDEEKLKWILELTCQKAASYKNSLSDAARQNLGKVAILATPMIEHIIAPLGFSKENYKFPIVIHLLDKNIDKKLVRPENWYVSAND
jgi:hypothetical protein